MLTSSRATRKPTGVLALMVPLMLVLFISNLDATIGRFGDHQ